MSERKVLNKYYPPDFDPAKLPKLRQSRDRQYTVRIMAPFNMQCKTCGEYIYKGKKFNAKTENVIDEAYLGLRIYRFYIKCPKCISEINFKTDPENTDYTLEHGATRLFEAAKAYQKQEEQEKKNKEEEEANNPMKILENRTKDSKLEMEVIENLEELREMNTRQAHINYADILKQKAESEEALIQRQEEEDEQEIRKIFGNTQDGSIKRLLDTGDDEDEASPINSSHSHKRPTDYLTEDSSGASPVIAKKQKSWEVSIGGLSSSKSSLAGLVKIKKAPKSTEKPNSTSISSEELVKSLPIDSGNIKSIVTKQQNASEILRTGQSDIQRSNSSEITHTQTKSTEEEEDCVGPLDSAGILSSIHQGLVKQQQGKQANLQRFGNKAISGGLSLLGGYADSDSVSGSSDSDDS